MSFLAELCGVALDFYRRKGAIWREFLPKPMERYRAVPKGGTITHQVRHGLSAGTAGHDLGPGPARPTSYELNNLPLFFFTIKGYNEDKRFNQMSFSFSSPLFCCRVPGARHRVFCCILGFLQAARQIGICRGVGEAFRLPQQVGKSPKRVGRSGK